MNKAPIIGIIIGVIVVGVAAYFVGMGSQPSPEISEISEEPSTVSVTENESGTKSFSVSMSDEVGIADTGGNP